MIADRLVESVVYGLDEVAGVTIRRYEEPAQGEVETAGEGADLADADVAAPSRTFGRSPRRPPSAAL